THSHFRCALEKARTGRGEPRVSPDPPPFAPTQGRSYRSGKSGDRSSIVPIGRDQMTLPPGVDLALASRAVHSRVARRAPLAGQRREGGRPAAAGIRSMRGESEKGENRILSLI